jgi:hypothetical protein
VGAVRAPEELTGPVLLRERWAWPRIAVAVGMAVVALVVPGTAALVLRPENPGEGYAALSLAAAVLAWQGYRAVVSAVEVSPEGIRRLGLRSRPIPWAAVEDVHWHTVHVHGRGAMGSASPITLHRLRATVGGRPVDLTRYPARDHHADRFTRALRALGVDVTTPDRSDAAGTSAIARGRRDTP